MPLENATLIYQLDHTSPDGDLEFMSEGDDHLRMIKLSLKNNVPNWLGIVTATHTEVNYLVGVTSSVIHNDQKNVANGAAGLDANARVLAAQMPFDPTFATIRLTSTTTADLASGGQAFQVGASTSLNLAASPDRIQARINGSPGGLYLNPYGGRVELGIRLGADPVILVGNYTAIAGANIRPLSVQNLADGSPADGASQYNYVSFLAGDERIQAYIGFLSHPSFFIRNANKGGGLDFEVTNAGGSVEEVFQADASGGSRLYYQGATKFSTQASGIQLTGSTAGGNGGAHASSLLGYDSVGISRWDIGYIGDSNLYINAYNQGASRVIIRGRNAAGTVDNAMVDAVADAGVTLLYQNSPKVSSTNTGIAVTGIATVTAGTLITAADFPEVTSVAGYKKFPGGLTIQWGETASIVTGNEAIVTFPIAFTTLYQVTATPETSIGGGTGAIAMYSLSATGVRLVNNMGQNAIMRYMAVGII